MQGGEEERASNTWQLADRCEAEDYDFVSGPEDSPSSSPRAYTGYVPARPSTPQGWSTLDLADNDSESIEASKPFQCVVCSSLLRCCVECPRCHSLFCGKHLSVVDGESPCPCHPCTNVNATEDVIPAKSTRVDDLQSRCASDMPLHPAEAFLPNIPVQRMADAIPSTCEACGVMLSWGELSSHECDLQEISCGDRAWGCSWRGRRGQMAAHTASACPGRLARVESELAEVRADLASTRVALAAAEEGREAATRQAALLMTRCEGLSAESDNVARKQAVPEVSSAQRIAVPPAKGQAKSIPAAFMRCPPNIAMGAPTDVLPQTSRSADDEVPNIDKLPAPRRPKGFTKNGSAKGTPSVEAACQAPVPAVEACLRPYLDDPASLLQKRIAVFWPRQGRWYAGRPTKYKSTTKEHRVEYDDGDVRDHVLANRSWGLLG